MVPSIQTAAGDVWKIVIQKYYTSMDVNNSTRTMAMNLDLAMSIL